ncbi:MAG: selenocysteine-specific translation elongation factor [Spirochaetes bacterium]|nr:selenocysteine-specific translation elongation factor [Spirochaetota bacterium]
MFVVGTSGHIDHGKTSLILALTGEDCDRLPEEKAREMTIDIGFASTDLPGYGAVSFIDVPGHERFIRNMVAGAWGIDLGLLVVAVDDGWMPQTEDHFRVLQLLGIERIIVVLNKIDCVEEGMIDLVEEEVRGKIDGTPYRDADIARVSSKTGAGINTLKKAITDNLKKLSRARNADKPFMYIDRVFASKGYGTVVTGTLRNGMLHSDDLVHIQPGAMEARIKRIESHHSTIAEGSPSQRTALNLSGIPADSLKRGQILYRAGFFTESGEIVAQIRLLSSKKVLKNNTGIEVLIGTAAVRAKIILFSGDTTTALDFPGRIKFDEPWYAYPGQPLILTSPGGFRIIGGGRVLFPGYEPRRHRDRVQENLGLIASHTLEEYISFFVAVRGHATQEDLDGTLSQNKKEIDRACSSLLERGVLKKLGPYLLTAGAHDDALKRVSEAVKSHVGLNQKELSDTSDTDPDICRLIIAGLVSRGQVAEKEGRFFPGTGVILSKAKMKLLESVLASGGEGMELDRLKDESMKRDARELIKLGSLVSLDGNILYHKDVYEKMKNAIMSLFKTKDKITVPEAKDVVGLSRKYILPLLNRIERDGLIKRLGDFRIKS